MKRLIVMFAAIALFGCGILKTGRSPAAETTVNVVESVEERAKEEVRKHVSAFTAEDLYRSRDEKLRVDRRRRKATAKEQASDPVEEVMPEDPVSKKNIVEIVEIIQIIDDTGNVVASKKVK